MDLNTLLVAVRPRDDTGSATSDRYDYQKNWALCELLSRHAGSADYCIVLEHHEDVIVLDSEDEPSRVELYQIKSRDGTHWTLGELLKRVKGAEGPKLSYLGRLVLNKHIFGEHAQALHFMSNLPFKVKLASGANSVTVPSVKLSELSPGERKKVAAKLKREHAPKTLSDYEDCTTLSRCTLPLKRHDDHTQGVLLRFLDDRTPGAPYPVPVIYKHIFNEIRRKTNYQGECRTLRELIEHRSISRRRFEGMLRDITRPRDLDDLWRLASDRLQREGFSFSQLMRMRVGRMRYETDVLDGSNTALQSLRRSIRSAVTALHDEDIPLSEAITRARASLPASVAPFLNTLGPEYVNAGIILEYLSGQAGPGIFPSGSQSSPEAA